MSTPKYRQRFPTKVQLRAVQITNGYNLCELLDEPKVFISFSPAMTGGASQFAKFQVIRVGYRTDPKAHWADNGNKTFDIFTHGKEQALADAIEWTDAKYGKRDWVKDPFGDYQDNRLIALAWVKVDAVKV